MTYTTDTHARTPTPLSIQVCAHLVLHALGGGQHCDLALVVLQVVRPDARERFCLLKCRSVSVYMPLRLRQRHWVPWLVYVLVYVLFIIRVRVLLNGRVSDLFTFWAARMIDDSS